jgi:hypothetical protein
MGDADASGAGETQEQKRAAAAAYDYEGDARWADYWSNVLVPPHLAAKPEVLGHFRRKFYQRYIVSFPPFSLPLNYFLAWVLSEQHRSPSAPCLARVRICIRNCLLEWLKTRLPFAADCGSIIGVLPSGMQLITICSCCLFFRFETA